MKKASLLCIGLYILSFNGTNSANKMELKLLRQEISFRISNLKVSKEQIKPLQNYISEKIEIYDRKNVASVETPQE